MALNFGLLDPDAPAKIANSLYAGQQEQQKNMLAQQQMKAGAQQLETGRLQQQHSQMQMDQMIRDRDALAKLQQQFVANGKSPDLEVNADAMIQSGISHYVDIGFKLKEKLMDQKRYAAIMGGEPANAMQAAPMPAAPAAAPAAAPTPAPAAPAPFEPAPGVPIRLGFSPGASITTSDNKTFVVPDNQPVASQASVIAAQIQAYNDKIKAAQNPVSNNIAPAAAPANQLAFAPNPAAANVDVLRRQRNALLAMGTPQAVAAARALDADIAIASKEPVYINVPGVGLTNPRTREILIAEQDKPTELQRNFEYAQKQGFKGNIFAYEKALREAGRAPGAPRQEQPPVAVIDPVTGKPILVSRENSIGMTPASAAGKPVPVHAQKAIIGAAASIKKIDDAIALLGKEPKEGSTGFKGYLPDVALNRLYPEGTDARAAIANIGSLIIHERSGAAVTASETPRLLPFVPQITDNKETVIKKLTRLKQIQMDEAEALSGTYTPDQGFMEFKPGKITSDAPVVLTPSNGGLSSAEQAELEQLRKAVKK